jgi:hypothetical protein
MKLKKIISEIKGTFKLPIKKYYIGKIIHGAPYFHPWGFVATIISSRKLIRRSPQETEEYVKRWPYSNELDMTYNNYPMVRRIKSRIIKIFGAEYLISYGSPIVFKTTELGWKDKYETPRFEYSPSIILYFFKWQFCIFYTAPIENMDSYWEMILWYLHYADKNIEKAEKTWPWRNFDTKESTWDNSIKLKN